MGHISPSASSSNQELATQLGYCFISIVVLRALATELALKALYVKEMDRNAQEIHQLDRLFDDLGEITKRSVECRFQHTQASREIGNGKKAIRQVLTEHRDDFVSWRYLDITRISGVELPELKAALEAIVQECQS